MISGVDEKNVLRTGLPLQNNGKAYLKAEVKAISFDNQDVIRTSGEGGNDPWVIDPYDLDATVWGGGEIWTSLKIWKRVLLEF